MTDNVVQMRPLKDDVQLFVVSPYQIETIWPAVEHFIGNGVAHSNGELTVDFVKQGLINNDLMLIVVYTSDFTTLAAVVLDQIVHASGKRDLIVLLTGGVELLSWLELIQKLLIEVAKECDCDYIQITGRRGWEKHLSSLGYKRTQTVLHCKVGE